MIIPGLFIAYGMHGRGVFTSCAIEKGEVVEVAPALDLYDEDIPGLVDYVYDIGLPNVGRLVLGYGSLYSHSDTPNLEVDHGPSYTTFRTVCDVAANDELTHDYGATWWASRPEETVDA